MGPADLAPDTAPPEALTPEQAKVQERNWFYNSLSPEAKERFLAALEVAESRGLSADEAWIEAVESAETSYGVDRRDIDTTDRDAADLDRTEL